MKRNYSNLKYVTLDENNFPRFFYVKRSFNRASRRRHVYKMHAVEHDDGRLFITRELRKEVFHIPVDISTFTCATCGMERKCYCARPSTFQREFRMLPRRPCLFQVGIDRRLVMTYKINAIYRHPTIISATNRERYFRLKKKVFVLIKRQWFVERDAVVTCR